MYHVNDTSELLSAVKQGATLLFTFPAPFTNNPQQVQVDQYGWYYWCNEYYWDRSNKMFDKKPKAEYTSIHVLEQVLEELKDFKCEIL